MNENFDRVIEILENTNVDEMPGDIPELLSRLLIYTNSLTAIIETQYERIERVEKQLRKERNDHWEFMRKFCTDY